MRVNLFCLFVLFFFPLPSQSQVLRDSILVMLQDSINNSISFPSIIKEKAFEKYMDLTKSRGNVQGGACFGNYLFVGYHRNRFVDIYDLSNRTFICSMPMQTPEPRSKCHANTINFGSHFYKQGDEFPLLYVSSGYSISNNEDRSNVYVYRLSKATNQDGSFVFKSELVQTISVLGSGGWTECVTDNEHDALWFRYDKYVKRCFLKYHVPDVRLKNSDINPLEVPALDTLFFMNFRNLKHSQGMFCHEGNIYIPSGVPSWGEEPYLSIVNLEKKDYTHIINLVDLEMINRSSLRDNTWEPEFFFVFDGNYFMGYRRAVYKLNMELVKKENYFYNVNYR